MWWWGRGAFDIVAAASSTRARSGGVAMPMDRPAVRELFEARVGPVLGGLPRGAPAPLDTATTRGLVP